MQWLQRLRDIPGVIFRDIPRFSRAFAHSGAGFCSDPHGWISLRNRIERLSTNPTSKGVHCDWQWGSDLHASQVLPSLGQRLMQLSLEEWPIRFSDTFSATDKPDLTFIFSHAGTDRLPLLRQTIRSLFAQEEVTSEIIVVDQSASPIADQLPPGVRYHHLSKTRVPAGWHKAWGFNVGARLAKGSLLVFQDGDVCAPSRYGHELLQLLAKGEHKAFSIQRFLYYLSKPTTQALLEHDKVPVHSTPKRIFQNWKGGTIAVEREAFWSIGGFDEGFVDWGGEDDEFYDRCLSIGHLRFGYMPFIHLWHTPQPDRKVTSNPNIAKILPWRMSLSHAHRIAELGKRQFGSFDVPDPFVSYKKQMEIDSR